MLELVAAITDRFCDILRRFKGLGLQRIEDSAINLALSRFERIRIHRLAVDKALRSSL
jgi:hypothetical protein